MSFKLPFDFPYLQECLSRLQHAYDQNLWHTFLGLDSSQDPPAVFTQPFNPPQIKTPVYSQPILYAYYKVFFTAFTLAKFDPSKVRFPEGHKRVDTTLDNKPFAETIIKQDLQQVHLFAALLSWLSDFRLNTETGHSQYDSVEVSYKLYTQYPEIILPVAHYACARQEERATIILNAYSSGTLSSAVIESIDKKAARFSRTDLLRS